MPAKRTSPKLDVNYSYRVRNSSTGLISSQVEKVRYYKPGIETQLLPTLNYTYDVLGNITQIKKGDTNAAGYTYDSQNQVTQEVLQTQTSDYTYDTFGNLRSKKTTYSNGSYEQYTYTYGNGAWQDQLTAISYRDTDGNTHNGTFSYDAVGNPTTYNNGKKNWTFTWQHGRQLATATSGSTAITNTYDVDGIRDSKTVNGVKHTYTTLGGKIVREAYGSTTIDYFYDNDSRPYKMVVKNGTSTVCTGYFAVNLQGDVIAVIDSNGAVAVEYEYDAWGREVSHSTSGSYGSSLYNYNALKYRGYYYDAETGFYYVSSRYYDPEIGRFISADTTDVLGVSSDLYDKNLYAYCDNNPVMRIDTEGQCWATVGIIVAGGVVGALLGAFSAAATEGNVIDSAIEGALTGVIGSACGLLSIHPLGAVALASLGGGVVDLGMQLTAQYGENGCVDLSKIDKGSIVKTGLTTGLGTAIPAFGDGAKNTIDAFGTTLIWAEGATLITCADIVLTNTTSGTKVKSVGVSSNRVQNRGKGTGRITGTMTTADYFRQKYNAS